jgi:hypothetical protein
MSSVVSQGAGFYTFRRVPAPGEIGSVSHCPLCAGGKVPCLACRDEIRARLDEMQLVRYAERAVN